MAYLAVCVYQPEHNGTPDYFAWHPDLDGALAQGETPAAALASLDATRAVILEYLAEAGLPIPAEKPMNRWPPLRIDMANPVWESGW